MQLTDPQITLRPVNEGDFPFLLTVYGSIREDELMQTGWSEQEKLGFIQMQFDAQHRAYSGYPDTEFLVIAYAGADVGRLYLQHQKNALHIVDISLLKEYRRRGIGHTLLSGLFAKANSQGKVVQIHVEKNNPARKLYAELGFQPVADKGLYLLMRKEFDEKASLD
ncbi:GNAT family N-acetyltransferase [Undibacterium sp. CY7W]|uniref:GNAT family N-acetyltransferase n=1 Tax=Undibacterium rugosum TaxID=2762291 RepID=A0A923I433_9BURK|nr:GNAT family N-acetyltransferase [Undibacterium rugosum]MBC3936782.1 GNAT family N-acetyltransferase [Undibacterium rugosum]